jgi:hypothetical protein
MEIATSKAKFFFFISFFSSIILLHNGTNSTSEHIISQLRNGPLTPSPWAISHQNKSHLETFKSQDSFAIVYYIVVSSLKYWLSLPVSVS